MTTKAALGTVNPSSGKNFLVHSRVWLFLYIVGCTAMKVMSSCLGRGNLGSAISNMQYNVLMLGKN